MADISSLDFKEALKNGNIFNIIDVREPLEFHTFNIGGTNLPLGKIPLLLEEKNIDYATHQEIIMVCQRGIRSKTAKILFEKAGYKNVKNLLGGIIKLQKL